MKIYISGGITDVKDHLIAFQRGVTIVELAGHEAVNPCTLGQPDFTYEQFMRSDIIEMLSCDAIYMLDGWEKSGGARVEHMVAAVCGLELYYEVSRQRTIPVAS